MSVILQISDTHFGTEQPPVVEALLALAWQLQPDLIVLSGDVTQRARPAEFAAAAAFVARLPPGPRLVVPGNHDIPLFNVLQRVVDPFQGYRQCLGSALEDSRRLPDVFMTGVNSVRAWRHKHGSLSPEQIEAVAERLRRAGPTPMRIVVVHHPLDVHDAGDLGDIVHGASEAVRAWARAGADLVLSGHVHVPLCRPLAVRYGPEAGACWTAVAGTATSYRIRGGHPNSVNVIRVDHFAGEVRRVLEQRDYDSERQAFRVAATRDLSDRVLTVITR